MYELTELKKIRKNLGITQAELAKKANVSQSLIAKIESEKLDPSYTNAKKIFETLSMLSKNDEIKAKDIMHPKILYAKPNDSIKEILKIMKNKSISQMPVIKNEKVVGYISESLLLEKILEGDSFTKIGEIMEDSPPIIPPDSPKGIIANLLQHFPFVLVEDKGKLVGIITKSDLLQKVFK